MVLSSQKIKITAAQQTRQRPPDFREPEEVGRDSSPFVRRIPPRPISQVTKFGLRCDRAAKAEHKKHKRD